MADKPLQGRGIVVTRPVGQAQRLARLLEDAGARPILFPTIEIEPLAERPLPDLAQFDLVIFVSPTAAEIAFESSPAWPAEVRVAAIGKGTRRVLERHGLAEVLAPEGAADSEALLARSELQALEGRRVLIVRGEGGRERLGETLAERGAQVRYHECYRRRLAAPDPEPLAAAWQRGEVHAVTVSSVESFENLLRLVGDVGRERLARTPLFATHERIAEHARGTGVKETHVAGPGDEEMAAGLVAYFGPRMTDPSSEAASPPAPPPAPPRRERRSWTPLLLLLGILVAAALATVFWLDARHRIGATQEELARRLRDLEAEAREARAAARQAQEAGREAQAKLGPLEARLAESQSQQVALEALYQDLSRNRDEWQLAEIEQMLAIASHQLQLAGNVRAALLALQLAEARLARGDRPQFLPVRRALARDIERLKALPTLDVTDLANRLDALVAQVENLPLAFDERAQRSPAEKVVPASAEDGFWSRLAAEVWNELRQLVVVRHLGSAEPPLLAPSQAYFLRENLRLRLLNARLMLLARNEAGYREDLRAAQRWIQRYFDTRSPRTVEALNQLKQLASAPIAFETPSIGESLEAVRSFQARSERAPR